MAWRWRDLPWDFTYLCWNLTDKITAKHLERAAYVYIRQSSWHQVRNNQESRRRQYALEDRARELGFNNVVIIDEDLGVSGSGHRERPPRPDGNPWQD
jgi:hypothetical protein